MEKVKDFRIVFVVKN